MALKVVNPYGGSVVAEVDYDEGSVLEEKIVKARIAYESWRRTPLSERKTQVQEGLERFLSQRESIEGNVTRQMGKPLWEAKNEVNTMADRAETSISIAEDVLAHDILPEKEGFFLRIDHAPLGLVFNIAAWNYPLLIPINVIVPALLAGNSVILKHSAKTPLTGQAFEDAFGNLNVPNLVTHVVLSHGGTARLIGDERVNHVAFTGSVEGGRSVYQETAKRFIDAGLELGGKDPAYVAQDADLAFTVPNVVEGALYNAGQSCCAVERVYVHEKVYDDFASQAQDVLKGYSMGDPMDPETMLGPLVTEKALQVLEEQIEDAVRLGAEVLLGGQRNTDLPGNFFPPTLVVDVPNQSMLMQEESFGPVLPVLKVKNDEEALKHMNDTRYGLTASIWTKDQDRAERFAGELDAGTIFQNRCDYLDPLLPWTGVRDSGKGSSLSRYGFYHLTRPKSIHFRTRTSADQG